MTGASVNAFLTSSNQISTLGPFTATGSFTLNNGQALTVGGGVAAGTSLGLTVTGALTLGANLTAGTIATLTATGAINQTAGVISTSSLTGSAISVSLNNANQLSFLGPFTVAGGSFSLSNGKDLIVSGGVAADTTLGLNVTGSLSLGARLSAGSTATLTATGAITQTSAGISATTLTGSAANASLTGSNQITALGSFATTSAFSLVNGQDLTVNGAVNAGTSFGLNVSGALTLTGSLTAGSTASLTAAGAITASGAISTVGGLTVTTPAAASISGVVSGAGGLTHAGSGTTTLSAANTYSGATLVNAGMLALSGSGSISASSKVTNNASFDISGVSTADASGATIKSLAGTSTGATVVLGAKTLNLSLPSDTFAGKITGTGGLKISSGFEILTGASDYTGVTNIWAGANLQLGNGGATGSISGASAVTIGSTGFLTIAHSDTVTLANNISGTGALVQSGTGTTILTGTNTNQAFSIINAGTLQLGNGTTAGTVTSGFSIGAGAALTIKHSDAVLLDKAISGAGSLSQIGSGTTTLSGNDTYTGATNVNSGTLLVNGSLASASVVTVAAGATLGGTGQITGSVNVSGIISGGTTTTTGVLNVRDLTLASGSTFHQDIIANVGLDRIDAHGTVTLAGTLDLALGSGFTTATGDSILLITNSSSTAVQGQFGAVTVNGSAATLTGNSFQYQGHTYLIDYAAGDGNEVAFRDVTAAPTPTPTPGNPSTDNSVSSSAGQTQTLTNVSSGSVTLNGPGTLVLTGTNTYTGPTTVNAGTLLVDGSIVSPTDVKSGGTLGGHGTTGTVTIEAGGTLSPGNSPGVLTTRDLTLAAGATLKEEIGGTAQGQFDQTKVIGTVALNGATLNLASFGSFVSARGNQFVIIDNDGTDAVQGTFAGLANGSSVTLGSHSYQINYRGGDGNDVVLTDVTLPDAATAALFGSIVTSAASQTGSVYALYQGLLNRTPDALGLEGFSASLQAGAKLIDVATAILGSAERGGLVTDPNAYVQSLYSNVLHRTADSAGLSYFTGELNAGVSQATVAVQIASSTEAQQVNAATFQTGVFVPDTIDAAVARLYYGVLGRAPDATGLGGFEAQVKQAAAAGGVNGAIQGLANVANVMLGSQEYGATHASQSNASFVDSLFVGALGRHADAGGSAFYVNELAQGASQAQVALQIAQSPEAQVHLVGQIELGFHLV